MKKPLKVFLWSLCLCLLLLCGCAGDPDPTVVNDPIVGQTHPDDTVGLETTRLSVEPWNSGRLAQCDQFRSGETETGFYFAYMGMLYYGDKSDLRLWVPVCPDPDCDHANSRNKCKARMDAAFVLRDGRIYHLTPKNDGTMDHVPIFKTPVASMAPDGSDGRLEYVIGGLGRSSALLEFTGVDEKKAPATGLEGFYTSVYAENNGERMNLEGTQAHSTIDIRKDGSFAMTFAV